MSTDERKLLQPEVFLALALAAEQNGGVGRGKTFEGGNSPMFRKPNGGPCCIYGLALWLDGVGPQAQLGDTYVYDDQLAPKGSVTRALQDVGLHWRDSDVAVARAEGYGAEGYGKVPFEKWCEEANVGFVGEDA